MCCTPRGTICRPRTAGTSTCRATQWRTSRCSAPTRARTGWCRGTGIRCRSRTTRASPGLRDETTMTDTDIIPVIDLGPYLAGDPGALDRAAGELRFALTEIGFYFIVNHGVLPELVRDAFRQAARFHVQPLEKKLAIRIDKHNVGYLPMRGDTLRTSTVETVTKPNLNEALFVACDLPQDHPEVLAGRRFRSANQWPADLPGFRETVVAYCDTMERLVQKLVRLYARALALPAAYFDQPFAEPQY